MKRKQIRKRDEYTFFNAHNLMVVGIALSIGLLLLVMAGVMGARQGFRDRQSAKATKVAVHYRRGEEYLAHGNADMARAEFTLVLKLDPGNRAAMAYLNRLDAATPAPTSTSSKAATVTVSTRAHAAAQAFQEAMESFESGNWEKAISGLETVQSLDPEYRPKDVEETLFKAYANLGRDLIKGGRIEEGLRALQAAQKLHPNDPSLQKETEEARTYQNGITYWWADWDKAIEILTRLYQEDPSYLDVREKLAEAYAERGKYRAKKGNPCQGAEDLREALKINSTTEWQKAYYKVDYACKHPTPTVAVTPSPQITATLTAVVTPSPQITATMTMAITPTPQGTATPAVASTPTPQATATPTVVATPSPQATATPTAVATPSPRATATLTVVVTPSPQATATPTAAITPSPQATATPTAAGAHLQCPRSAIPGERLASRVNNRCNTEMITMDEGRPDLLTCTLANEGLPAWSPDDKLLANVWNLYTAPKLYPNWTTKQIP